MTESKKACTFVLFLAIVVITTAQTVFTAPNSKLENLNEVNRSPKLGHDLWATLLPERQKFPTQELVCESLQEPEPKPYSWVTVNISPEVVYIGDTFSTLHRA